MIHFGFKYIKGTRNQFGYANLSGNNLHYVYHVQVNIYNWLVVQLGCGLAVDWLEFTTSAQVQLSVFPVTVLPESPQIYVYQEFRSNSNEEFGCFC